MLGLSPARGARGASTRIIDFAELRDFTDLKLKNYSTGMHGPPRLQRDDPGRRRHPAHRRGAGRRRRRLPAEVLRRVRAHPARGHDRRCSSPTTWARSTASATARCCSSTGAVVELGEPDHVGLRYLQLNFSREAPGGRAGGGRADEQAASATGAPRSPRRGSRTSTARAPSTSVPAARARSALRVRFAADVEDPPSASRSSTPQNRTVVGATTQHADPTPGRFAGRRGGHAALHLRQRPRARTATR